MRDRLIHGYFNIDLRRVWQTVKTDLPILIATATQMLDESGKP